MSHLEPARSALQRIAERLRARREKLAFAESCTGGMLAMLATELAGSSRWFERGVVTYSNVAKQDLLAVPEDLIRAQGAVCEDVVRAMAAGVLANCPVQWAVAVTGIAGPDGGSADKPVGTVWVAWGRRDQAIDTHCFRFDGDRRAVREQTASLALAGLAQRIEAAG